MKCDKKATEDLSNNESSVVKIDKSKIVKFENGILNVKVIVEKLKEQILTSVKSVTFESSKKICRQGSRL